jgi:predicted AlkP superfamily pyrophosphatase or phosphodiesterase
MRRFARFAALACFAVLAGCATPRPEPTPAPPQTASIEESDRPLTIIVSIDAFRPDYRDRGLTPNIDALAARGLSGTMKPSFPTLTFPNHYAMATGLRPDRNGIVENKMLDPARPGAFFDSKEKSSADPVWWNEAEPIWVSAERAGIDAGAVLWPGTDKLIGGVRPSVWLPYDSAITSAQRVDFALDQARRPAALRPGLITVYFDIVDKTGHAHGTTGPDMDAAIRDADAAVGRLVAGLAAMDRPANLVVVSDHGLADVAPDHILPLGPLIDRTIMDVMTAGGPVVSVWPKPGQERKVAAMLLRPLPHLQCRRREDLPARLHYGRNPRVPPIYCMTDRGWLYAEKTVTGHIGDHGYDNDDPDMTALFVAAGPAFPKRATLPEFDNVDVYPLLRELIGLPAKADVDGTDAPFRGLVRP